MRDEIPLAQPPPEPRPDKLWRWRVNPLRRPLDVLQAWIGVIVAASVLAAAPAAMTLVGHAVNRSLRTAADDQVHSRHRATAEVLHDVPQHPEPGSDEADHARYPADVRYTDATGRTRTARTDVPPGLPAGGTVQVWVDGKGAVTDPPMSAGEIRGLTTGWIAATGAAVTVTGITVYAAAGYALERRNLAEWEREWAETAPRWTRST
jgi:hypothetical protein